MYVDTGAGPLKSNVPHKSQQFAVTVTPELIAQHLLCIKEGGQVEILQCGSAPIYKDAKTHIFCS